MSGRVDTKVNPYAAPGKVNVSRTPVGYTPPRPDATLPPLPQLIKEQPLPVTNTDQYQQTQAMYAQALAQLQASQQAQMAMQLQLNRMAANDPTARQRQQLMGLYQGDPFADLRAQQMQQNQVPQRFSTAFYGQGY